MNFGVCSLAVRSSLYLSVALSLLPALSSAQPAPEKAVAEGLFQEGRKLMQAGKYEQACPKFAESHRLAPKLGTLLNLATCHEKVGRTASAWAEFMQAQARAKRAGQQERERYAQQHAQALEAKLSKLIVEVEQPSDGLDIFVNGERLGRAAWGTPIPLDPGEVALRAERGRASWRGQVQLPAGPAITHVKIPRLARDAAASQAAPAPTLSPAAEHESNAQQTWGWVALGVGGVGLVAGGYFGLSTLAKRDEAAEHCQDTACDQQGVDLRNEARTTGHWSTAGFAVGVAGVATGLYLLFTADSDAPQSSAVIVAPAHNGASLSVWQQF